MAKCVGEMGFINNKYCWFIFLILVFRLAMEGEEIVIKDGEANGDEIISENIVEIQKNGKTVSILTYK